MKCGTRGSPLAIAQTNLVLNALGKDIELKVIKTSGDLYRGNFGEDGITKQLFTKEIDFELANGEIDFAVHSLKDVQLDHDFHIVVPKRGPHNDVIISDHNDIFSLPPNARVGTGSPRRVAELKRLRSDLEAVPIRGNIETRIKRLNDLDAILVAEAGLRRLGIWGEGDHYYIVLSAPSFMPAACQGALAVTCRKDDKETIDIIEHLRDIPSTQAVTAELEFMRSIGGNCHVPAGAWAKAYENSIVLHAAINDRNSKSSYRGKLEGKVGDERSIGRELARRLLSEGAEEIVRSYK